MIFLEIWVSEANFSSIFSSLKTETFSRNVDNINKKQIYIEAQRIIVDPFNTTSL